MCMDSKVSKSYFMQRYPADTLPIVVNAVETFAFHTSIWPLKTGFAAFRARSRFDVWRRDDRGRSREREPQSEIETFIAVRLTRCSPRGNVLRSDARFLV